MLFNSYVFIFAFLPVTLLGFYLLGRGPGPRAAISWLVLASLFFYGWWNPHFVVLILASIVTNFAIGSLLQRGSERLPARQRALLIIGIGFNLALLGYYKYANFFVDTVGRFTESSFHLETIILPLGISFFTFQQISYLVDVYRGPPPRYSFIHYSLFVAFFPQLIAGPIVHHAEMLPQFANARTYRFDVSNLATGSTIFVIGLFKKVVIADSLSRTVNPVFGAAAASDVVGFADAWAGSLAYTLQLYFDFSGYSDMAIGLARMFGIYLPINFNSPYKAANIADFWRRWHMTLSRFLRDYVYFALGGNRRGEPRRYVNLMATMLLGGLWHGAGWTFVFWGGLHGVYLCVHHLHDRWRSRRGGRAERARPLAAFAARTATFFAVVVGWVFFRAESFPAAWNLLGSMFGAGGFSLDRVLGPDSAPLWIVGALTVAMLGPNTQEIMAEDVAPARVSIPPRRARWLHWNPTPLHAVLLAVVFFVSILHLSRADEFLYFQF